MALGPGSRFGAYEIAEPIGKGGMGEVYRATDSNLKRDVALKVLPPAFVEDADRLARFRREAEILASLNHPNIATIHGLENVDGETVIIMELVEGLNLAERIAQGPIPPDEAMGIALQVVAALEAAHEKHIVHRDLKPANVIVRADGTVKVLDFGISKPIDPTAISGSPVMTTPAVTQTGVILGTAAYMSPEQARGKFVDERTDVWAFGCLLFEMLTGQPAFVGEDVMLTLARVLANDTNLDSIPATISPAVRHTIRLCLQKDPRKRIADIRDVRLALEGTFESQPAPRGEAVPDRRPARRALLPVATLVAGAAVVAVLSWMLWPDPPPRQVSRFSQSIPNGIFNHTLAIADDGSRVAYLSTDPRGVFIRDFDAFEARPVEATLGSDVNGVCFSPDGESIAYAVSEELRRAQISGGASRSVTRNSGDAGTRCDWAPDGNIYFGGGDGGIRRVAAAGGEIEVIVPVDAAAGDLQLFDPLLLPGGNRLLFMDLNTADNELKASVVAFDLDSRTRTTIVDIAGGYGFVPSEPGSTRGHVVYGQDGSLFAAAIDVADLSIGEASPVAEQVLQVIPQVLTQMALSESGVLAYLSADGVGDQAADEAAFQSLTVADRSGAFSALGSGLSFSPPAARENRAVTSIIELSGAGIAADLWLYQLDNSRAPTRLGLQGLNRSAVWSPDSTSVIYLHASDLASVRVSGREIRSVAVDRSAAPVTLALLPPENALVLDGISPDARFLVGSGALEQAGNSEIWLLPLEREPAESGPATADDLQYPLATPDDEHHPAVSPDGRWIAYSSDATGRHEIHVRSFPDFAGNYVVSTAGGVQPVWNPAGDELFYVNEQRMMVVRYTSSTTFDYEDAAVVFEDPALAMVTENPEGRHYDYHPASDRFVVVSRYGIGGPNQSVELRIVRNFADELRELVPL
jgi:serine/threonine-protein kinase